MHDDRVALDLFFLKKNYCMESDSVSESVEVFSRHVQKKGRGYFYNSWEMWFANF